jgi:hypothetical protein
MYVFNLSFRATQPLYGEPIRGFFYYVFCDCCAMHATNELGISDDIRDDTGDQ